MHQIGEPRIGTEACVATETLDVSTVTIAGARYGADGQLVIEIPATGVRTWRAHVAITDLPELDGSAVNPAIRYPGLAVSFTAELGLALWLLVKGVRAVDSGAGLPGGPRGEDPLAKGARG